MDTSEESMQCLSCTICYPVIKIIEVGKYCHGSRGVQRIKYKKIIHEMLTYTIQNSSESLPC